MLSLVYHEQCVDGKTRYAHEHYDLERAYRALLPVVFFFRKSILADQDNITLLFALIGGSAVLLLLAITVVTFLLVHYKKIYRKEMLMKDMEIVHAKELIDNFINATEGERIRLAADLHDDVGTALSHLRLTFNGTFSGNSDGTVAVHESIDGIIQNVRDISHNIMPASLNLFGPCYAVGELAQRLSASGAIQFHSEIVELPVLPNASALAIYRVLQELMNNTIKHSGATSATIKWISNSNQLKILYADNGSGFKAEDAKGFGMRGIDTLMKKTAPKWWYDKKQKKVYELADREINKG